ncbi:MAG: Flp pilus assembly complex ATPase component TadA [Planctomycetes bacterium]|nr:Flp pilus assembly complex ATPase component TadA [Planctomycetota bacterium]
MSGGGKLGQILLAAGKITEEQLTNALEKQEESGQRLGEALVEMECVTEQDITQVLGQQLGVPHVWLRKGLVDPKVVSLIPQEKAEVYHAVAMFKVRDTLTVAMSDPQSLFVIDQLGSLTGCKIQPVLCRAQDITAIIQEYYGKTVEVGEFLSSLDETDVELVADTQLASLSELEEMAEGSPIINLVNLVVLNGIHEGASDIHIEPDRKRMRVRYRVDGILREVMSNKMELHPAIISRVKVMANLDIGERRRPQEGRIRVVAEGREVDLRVSSLPTVIGEKIVMRILDQSRSIVPLEKLGLTARSAEEIMDMIAQPYGLVLVTGPTGSGKTTTLYSAINLISSMEKNIVTIEDPVEYQLDLINQVQVNERMELTFANVLRHVLRQDPDVVMVGEIRDRETAEIAIQAALTGHLVISTLHTNDSCGAVARLVDMGVEPYLLASALTGVVAQRLIRSICSDCSTTFIPPPELLRRVGWKDDKPLTMSLGTGCKTCFDSGYKGRLGIYEMLRVDTVMRNLILTNPTIDQLREEREKSALPSLKESGFELVRQGKTTIEEVMRAVFIEGESDIKPDGLMADVGKPAPQTSATGHTQPAADEPLQDSAEPVTLG